uniref:Uncharacterized protein n=1 Tax=Lepeophtheirus salmonis TaxID=72036 RepID=A0A0K2UGA3_LEPSM
MGTRRSCKRSEYRISSALKIRIFCCYIEDLLHHPRIYTLHSLTYPSLQCDHANKSVENKTRLLGLSYFVLFYFNFNVIL